MSLSLAKQLIRYRTWIVAVVNAGITWVILIIAPLGLFAVILCTLGVFIGSLVVGRICDRALFQLLRINYRDVMVARRESENIDITPNTLFDLSILHRAKNADD